MIGFFPDIYPDELLYSWFSRYYVRSGYTAYVYAAEELFENRLAKPNLEFLIKLNDDTKQVVTRKKSMEELIMKHTMFPQYARFIPYDRRNKAFQLLLQMDKEYNNQIYAYKGMWIKKRWLRYCPVCAKEAREKYGECYWNRKHQIMGVDVCGVHGCKLINSTVGIISKESPSLTAAELIVPYDEIPDYDVPAIEIDTARYITAVFGSEINMNRDIPMEKFLHSKMEYTKYLCQRGVVRKTTVLFEDVARYYKDLRNNPFQEQWQVQKLFDGKNLQHQDICLMAKFLKVSVEELVNPMLPEKPQYQVYDERVKLLHNQGLNYRQIADEMGTSYDTVKLVGTGRYEKKRR